MFNFKVGDIVTRNLGGRPMYLKVTDVTETQIGCGPWVFDRETGIELDDEIDCVVSWLEPQVTTAGAPNA